MACYTLSKCILKSLDKGKKYIADILMIFTLGSNPNKVAIDKSNRIIDIYEELGQNNEFFSTWLSLMSLQPSNFELINVDTREIASEEEVFLKVCSSTRNQHKIIIHSHEDWENMEYETKNTITYENVQLRVYDRDEAIVELNPSDSGTINAYKSVIATDHSIIQDTKNK